MLPRYLRFARTVALVTTTATAGCRGEDADVPRKDTGARDTNTADVDDALETPDASDAGDATDAVAVTEGACRILVLDGGGEIGCEAGSMCSYPEADGGDADLLYCTYGIDAAAPEGGVLECGLVSCGANCYCAGPAVSLCGCLHLGSSGPLAPPDLARA